MALAKVISETESCARFSIIDVGANVGDSALQILNVVDVDVICVEGDRYWVPFLLRNTLQDPRIHVVQAMLLPSSQDGAVEFAPVRANGTTRFVPGRGSGSCSTATAESLRASLPQLAPMRLIKSDTDGFDARLLPGLARAYADTIPVLFFEFDPPMARETGDPNPEGIWGELIALGYDRCVVWDNFGSLLGSWSTAELSAVSAILEKPIEERGYHYWDVAAIHGSDPHRIAIEQTFYT